ncbi:hypothetical protein M3Y98_00667900 [Aphelenchoides besseyi]|nr:hypothetical protein M3Y98_00667900 [Aphelenchoides besseyi]KAI6208873.1 hypothetical protein M3Y96_00161200 [Aphelenchoides besseyi]
MGGYESRPLGEGEDVFENGAKYGTSRVVHIEDLIDADDVRPQIELEQASVNLRFFQWAERSDEECAGDYKHCIENLKKAAPNLREACVCGCYAYKPDLNCLKVVHDIEVKDSISDEMKLIRRRFQILVDAFKQANIHLTSMRFSVYWIVDDKDLGTINFGELGKEVFGSDTTITKIDHVEWKFFIESTSVMLCFHFVDEQDYLETPNGRTTWTKTWAHDIA